MDIFNLYKIDIKMGGDNMGKCKECNESIADDELLCESCKLKQVNEDLDEQYLEDLLNSIEIPENDLSVSERNDLFDEINTMEGINPLEENDSIDDIEEIDMNGEIDVSTDPDISEESDNDEDYNNNNLVISEDLEQYNEPEVSEDLDISEELDALGDIEVDEYINSMDNLESIQTINDSVLEEKEDYSDNFDQNVNTNPSNVNSDPAMDDMAEDQDLMELLNMISGVDGSSDENPYEQDDLMSGISNEYQEQENSIPNDVFSMDQTMNDLQEPSTQNTSNSNMSDILENSLGVIQNIEDDNMDKAAQSLMDSEEKKKEKVGFFKKIFGNVVDENAKNIVLSQLDSEGTEGFEIDNIEKPKKKKKGKKGEPLVEGTSDENLEEGTILDKKALSLQKQQEKVEMQNEKKLQKEEKKKKRLEASAALAMEDQGRINPVGASIVFLFIAIIGMVVIIGTNLYSYRLNINNATDYLSRQKYDKAYDSIAGVNMKKSDDPLYDKVMTIMYVKKALNSYQNFTTLKMYPEALDSLLKGIEKYERYIEQAKELGIQADMDNLKQQIVDILQNNYQITIDQANQLIQISDQYQYTQAVVQSSQVN